MHALGQNRAREAMRGTPDPSLEFNECRSHHVHDFEHSIIVLYSDPQLSLAEAAVSDSGSTVRIYQDAAVELDSEQLSHPDIYKVVVAAFRKRFGKASDDESVPRSTFDDTLGGNPDAYLSRRAVATYSMLTEPSSKRITVGPVVDNLCRAIREGECGFHCPLIDFKGEAWQLSQFYGSVQSYLALPAVQRRMQEDPSYYQVTLQISEFLDGDGSMRGDGTTQTFGADGIARLVGSLDISLGLFRDALTYEASYGQYLTFDELPQVRAGSIY